MHDGDHDILGGGHESHGDHDHSHKHEDDHDHKHDHEHKEENKDKKKSDKMVKVIAGLVSVGLIVAFVLWKLI
jgi:ABC-type nickel/cobalt efflux system permease component RcnA